MGRNFLGCSGFTVQDRVRYVSRGRRWYRSLEGVRDGDTEKCARASKTPAADVGLDAN